MTYDDTGRAHRAKRSRPPYVLIVQEHQSERDSMRAVLEPDYEIKTVGDGFGVLSHVLERKPDLVVLDLVLPGIPGLEVIHALQSTGQEIPIVATVGAERRSEDWLRASIMGAQKLLRKPISPHELRNWVRAVIDGDHPSKRTLEAHDAASLLLDCGHPKVVKEDEFSRLVERAMRMDRHFDQRSCVALLQARNAALRDRVVEVCSELLRGGDFLARNGSDRLLILCPLTDPVRIPAIFERLGKPLEKAGVQPRQLRCGGASVDRVHRCPELGNLFSKLVPWVQRHELGAEPTSEEPVD